jgi:hypothetical protein
MGTRSSSRLIQPTKSSVARGRSGSTAQSARGSACADTVLMTPSAKSTSVLKKVTVPALETYLLQQFGSAIGAEAWALLKRLTRRSFRSRFVARVRQQQPMSRLEARRLRGLLRDPDVYMPLFDTATVATEVIARRLDREVFGLSETAAPSHRAVELAEAMRSSLAAALDTAQGLGAVSYQVRKVDAHLEEVGANIDLVKEGVIRVGHDVANVLAAVAAGTQAELALALPRLPQAARETLASLAVTEAREAVRRLVLAFADPDALPTALIPIWVSEPPTWLQDSAAGWAALGVLAEEYLFVSEAVECWLRSVQLGSPRRDYWLLRAAWLLFEQSLPGEDDAQLARADEITARIGDIGPDYESAVSALRAFIGGQADNVVPSLSGWSPADLADRYLRTRMLLVAALTAVNAGGSWASATAIAKEHYRNEPLPRIGLMLSRAMVQQAYAEPTADRVELLVSAYDIALQARDMLRATRARSLPAVKAAVEAAEMAGDERRVLRAATDWAEFEGEATVQERDNPVTAQAIVAAAAVLGLPDRARAYADGLPPGYERSLCQAMCADLPGTTLSAQQRQAMWDDVLALARNPSERLPAWDGLARAGAAELPGMREQIGNVQPAVAASLEAAAAAARGFHDQAVRLLLPFARANMTAARQLARIYDDHGDQVSAARTLLEAGTDFHNPDLVVHAADLLCDRGEYAEARAALERVLAEHGPEWPSRPMALRIAARAAEATHRLDVACDYLASAARLEPANQNTRWYLVQLLCQRGLSDQAWRAIKEAPEELTARNVVEARAWLDACYYGGPGGETFVASGLTS